MHPITESLAARLSLGKGALQKIYAGLSITHEEGTAMDFGCPCTTIGYWLDFLTTDTVELDHERGVNLHSLDSQETIFGGVPLEEVRKLKQKICEIIPLIDRLKVSPLVCELRRSRMINSNSVLAFPTESSESVFKDLMDLPDYAKAVMGKNGSRKPDHDECWRGLFTSIRTQTGTYHDQEIADVMTDLTGDLYSAKRVSETRYRVLPTEK